MGEVLLARPTRHFRGSPRAYVTVRTPPLPPIVRRDWGRAWSWFRDHDRRMSLSLLWLFVGSHLLFVGVVQRHASALIRAEHSGIGAERQTARRRNDGAEKHSSGGAATTQACAWSRLVQGGPGCSARLGRAGEAQTHGCGRRFGRRQTSQSSQNSLRIVPDPLDGGAGQAVRLRWR